MIYGIRNIARYNARMQKSIVDKLFFVDKIDPDVYIDYGCADGTLLNELSYIDPAKTYFGYDIDQHQINICDSRNMHGYFESDWNKIMFHVSEERGKKALILSSVVHEIYHYTPDKVDIFWHEVFNSGFDFICFRDMALHENVYDMPENDMVVKAVYDNAPYLGIHKQMKEFIEEIGSLEERINMIKFLMKYKYADNWEREMHEEYFPLTAQEYLKLFMEQKNYSLMYYEHYTLPFLFDQIHNDFQIRFHEPTHLKVILKLNPN